MGNGREIDKLLFFMHKNNASDLHLKVGSPPIVRVERQVRRLEMPALSGEQIYALVEPIMPERSKKEFEKGGSGDFAYSVAGIGRYRVNVFRQRGSVSVAARRVRYDIPNMQALHLPPGVQQITQFDQGMCIIAGPTGSGKSTTLAAMLDHINHTRRCHILTIEDPIEYLYRDDKAFVNQREVGLDVTDFHAGLRYALREDPDVILVGEMRDYETFEIALQAAETGHLVFGTLHASSAAGSIGRVLDLFPEPRHLQIRRLLAFNLRAVLVQRLLPGATSAAKVVPAVEVMIVNPSIKKLIAESGDNKIPDVVRGARQEGMQDMTESLHELVKSKLVAERTALEVAPNPEALQMLLRGITVGGSSGGIIGS
ncbi:MAG: type IV pilus twitching motility protein PilT [Planctomycetota bacterium]